MSNPTETRAPNPAPNPTPKPAPPRPRPRAAEIAEQLAAPFAPCEVEVKAGKVSGNRALALHYVDVRVVQRRLDEVLGVDGWQTHFQVLEHGIVQCTLSLKIGDTWLDRQDVGSGSDNKNTDDKLKNVGDL